METLLPRIYSDLKVDETLVLNVYNYGSRVYGTHKPTSDYDIFIVMDTTDPPLEFFGDGYFYKYNLHRGADYDVVIFSLENFKTLLRVHMLCAIECIFLPSEFMPVNKVELRSFFMEEAFSIPALRKAIGHEASYSFNLAKKCISKQDLIRPRGTERSPQDTYRGLKNLFHGIRYILFALQILTTKQVTDYHCANEYYFEIMTYMDHTDWSWDDLKARYAPIYKRLRHEFVETTYALDHPVEGVFEYHVTVETDDIDRFTETCRNLKTHRVKPIVIMLNSGSGNTPVYAKQVMTSNFVMGVFPQNLSSIQELAKKLEMAGFPSCRLKIEAKAKSRGVPLTSEQMSVWQGSYFEFHFKVKVEPDETERLFDLCRRKNGLIAWNALKPKGFYLITLRIYSGGLPEALSANKNFKNYLKSNGYITLQNQKEFVVYDSNPDLDKGWTS